MTQRNYRKSVKREYEQLAAFAQCARCQDNPAMYWEKVLAELDGMKSPMKENAFVASVLPMLRCEYKKAA